jgi:hypothetical protein
MNGEYAKIDDKVVTSDGTSATIVGFQEIDFGLIRNDGMLPGIYRNCHLIEIIFFNGTKVFEKDEEINPVGKISSQASPKSSTETRNKRKHTLDYDRPLPLPHFWECDFVKIRNNHSLQQKAKLTFTASENLLIVEVDYLAIEARQTKGLSLPCYEISDSLHNITTMTVKEEDLELVERGNVWNYYHQQLIYFNDLKTKAEFHHLLGKTQEIKNPNGSSFWSFDEAQERITAGLAHGVVGHSKDKCSLIMFYDKSVGDAVARQTLISKFVLNEL